MLVPGVALAVFVGGCGGGGGAAGGGGGGDPGDLPRNLTVTSDDAAEGVAEIQLAGGRFRLGIDEDCDGFGLMIVSGDGSFTYEKVNPAIPILFINDMPPGPYTVQQTDPTCTQWSIELSQVTAAQ
jgi:hypothetical protein